MKKKIRIISLLIIIAALSSCATLSTLDASAKIDASGNESIVVMGVSPEYIILLQTGVLDGSEFRPRTVMTQHFLAAPPKDGYLVARIGSNDPGEAVGIVGVTASNSIWGNPPNYKPCNSMSPVFTVPKGKVIYVGDVSYTHNSGGLSLQTSYDFIKAKEYIDANYPNLKNKLSESQFEVIRVLGVSCTRTVSIPIYIPRSK